MYCGHCGTRIDDDARFCPNCGAPVQQPGAAVGSAPATPPQPVRPTAPSPATGAALSQPGGSRRFPIPAIVAAVVVLVLILLTLLSLCSTESDDPEPVAAVEDAVPVNVSITAPNYNAATDSPIPLHVRGTTERGETVDEVHYVTVQSPSFDVDPGDYQVSLAASPLMDSGDVYDIDVTVNIYVLAPASQDAESATDAEAVQMDLEPKDPADVTDEDIDQAVEYAKKAMADPSTSYVFDEDHADEVRKKIEDRRDEAQGGDVSTQDAAPDSNSSESTDQASSPSQDTFDPTDLVGDPIEVDLVHNDWIDAADIPMWDFECDYFTCMMSDELEEAVVFESMGHTSGAYHVDGYLKGTDMLVMRFDGSAGDTTATVTFMTGGANVIWYAIRNGSCNGISAATAESYLKALTYNEMSASDAMNLDRVTFVNKVVGTMKSYQGPVIAASFQVK